MPLSPPLMLEAGSVPWVPEISQLAWLSPNLGLTRDLGARHLGTTISTFRNVAKFVSSSFRPLNRAHAICTLCANSLDVVLLWNLIIESQWMVCSSSRMYKDQWSLSKYGTTTVLLKVELCLKYFSPTALSLLHSRLHFLITLKLAHLTKGTCPC